MADNALDIKALNIESKEFSSADLFDNLDDENIDGSSKKKKKPLDEDLKKKEKEEEKEKEDEFEIKSSELKDLFGEEDDEKEEDEELEEDDVEDEEVLPKSKDETGDEGGEDNEEELNPFNSYAKALVELGIFVPEDDDDTLEFENGQDFADRWKYEFQKASRTDLNNYLQSRGNEALDWFDAVFNKGVSPKEYMQQWSTIEDISSIDMEDEFNQERVIKDWLRSQEYDNEDIIAEVNKLKNIGELEATAKRAHKVLVKKEASRLQEMKEKSANEEKQKKLDRENYRVTLTQLLNTKIKTREFDGIPVNQAVASEVFDSLYNYKYVRPTGEYMTQFEKDIDDLNKNPEMKLKVGLLLNILKKDPQMTSLKKKAVSKETNELFKDLAQKRKTLIRKQTPSETINSFGA